MSDARETPPTGLPGVGRPLEGTDARPIDEQGAAPTSDAGVQGGANEQQDALRAHAAAQGSDKPVTGGLDDTRASAGEGSLNDNDSL